MQVWGGFLGQKFLKCDWMCFQWFHKVSKMNECFISQVCIIRKKNNILNSDCYWTQASKLKQRSMIPYLLWFVLQIKEIKWGDVGGWTGQGGSLLGTKRYDYISKSPLSITRHRYAFIHWIRCVLISFFRTLPAKHIDKIAEQMRIHNINALLVIGGFEVWKCNIYIICLCKFLYTFCCVLMSKITFWFYYSEVSTENQSLLYPVLFIMITCHCVSFLS